MPTARQKNYFHLGEWTWDELDTILKALGFAAEWHFLDGPFEGPFTVLPEPSEKTLALFAAIAVEGSAAGSRQG